MYVHDHVSNRYFFKIRELWFGSERYICEAFPQKFASLTASGRKLLREFLNIESLSIMLIHEDYNKQPPRTT